MDVKRYFRLLRGMTAALVLLAVFGCAPKLVVVLEPDGVAASGGAWRPEDTDRWLGSGEALKISGAGTVPLEFRAVPGWEAPVRAAVEVAGRGASEHKALYTSRAPAAPTGVEAFSGVQDVLVTWDEQLLYTVAGYHVYRIEEGRKTAQRLTDEPLRALRYEDGTVTSGLTYGYCVTAVTGAGVESAESDTAHVVAGEVTLDLAHIGALPGEAARLGVSVRNAFGLSGDTMRLDIAFTWCDTETPVDVFTPDSMIALPTAVTAGLEVEATRLAEGQVRIIATGGTGAPALTGEGRLLEVAGTISPGLSAGAVICARIVDAELLSGNASVGYQSLAGSLALTGECMRGDVDANREITDGDAQRTLDIVVSDQGPTDCEMRSGDMNLDGRLNPADATIILRVLDGWYDDVPGTTNTPTLGEILRPRGPGSTPEPVRVFVATASGNAGDVVEVPVQVRMPEGGMHGASVTVSWPDDPELLELVAADAVSGPGLARVDRSRPGSARILVSRNTVLRPDAAGVVVLARLRYRLGARVPRGYAPPVTVQAARIFGAYGDLADWYTVVTWEDGAVDATPAPTSEPDPDPYIVPDPSPEPGPEPGPQPEPQPEPDPSGIGTLSGRVTDAATGEGVEGVAITTRAFTGGVAREVLAVTDSDVNGQFVLPGLGVGEVQLTYERSGYISTMQRAAVTDSVDSQLQRVPIVSSANTQTGGAAGVIVDAVTGVAVNGLRVDLRSGVLRTEDTAMPVVRTTQTDAGGRYFFDEVEAGTYTIFVSGPGYNAVAFVVVVIGGQYVEGQNGNISPLSTGGEIRAVLSWGASPNDLDAHLIGPMSSGEGNFHCYFGRPVPDGDYVALDNDVMSGYGPETITVYRLHPGRYRYYVHDYSNSGNTASTAMSNSGATVRVTSQAGTQEFNIRPNVQATVWTVFEIDGSNGRLRVIDEYSNTIDELDYGDSYAKKISRDAR